MGAMRFAAPVPILRMFDLEKAKDFYVGFLGFQVDWEHALSPPHPCTCRCRAAIAAST